MNQTLQKLGLIPQPSFASRISGTGSAFPEKRLTNLELCKRINSSPDWIFERTGIQERRISEPGNPNEFNSSLATLAAKRALEMASKKPSEIDQIIYATCTPDTLIPSSACWLQQKLGANQAWGVDINAACSGFVYALAMADQFIRTGQSKTILIVGADVLSAFTNWTDRSSCILFGDGAGAIVLEQAPFHSENRILSFHLQSNGHLWELFRIQAGGSACEVTPTAYIKNFHKMEMKGNEIFKIAVRTLAEYAEIALHHNQMTIEELDWLIPHQANLRIIEAVSKRLNFPMQKILINIQNFGNTSSATVPTALDAGIRSGQVQPGHTLLLDVFGAGLTYGSLLLRW